ncbi:MAG: cyclic nucleotide-binding domain-containing protein [Acidobacteria bacterium]|nr:cyclic nucleotide-binding domain-containing protein [Acidobacteriota bacterium]
MPLDWGRRPAPREETLPELIARKKYGRAIEVLRAQLVGRAPTAQMRLQLADLLVQAGRTHEAAPIFIALADEFTHDGFVAKAVAILKRVDRIDPGRVDVKERMARLVQQQHQRLPTLSVPAVRRVPEFGIEEISEEAHGALHAQTPAPGPVPTPESPPDPGPAVTMAPPAEPAPVSPGEEAQEPTPVEAWPEAVVGPAAGPPTPTPTVAEATTAEGTPETRTTSKIRRAFRKFLASLPGAGAELNPKDESAATPAAMDAPTGEVAATAAGEPSEGEGPLAISEATMVPSLEPAAPEAAATVESPVLEPAAIEPPTIEPPAVEPPTIEPPTIEPPTVEPAAVEPVALEPAAVEPMAALAAEPSEGEAESAGVTHRLKGVLRRLLHFGGSGTNDVAAPSLGDAPPVAEEVIVAEASEIGPVAEPAAEAPETPPATPDVGEEEPIPVEAVAESAPPPPIELEVVPEPEMSEQAFQDQVLDLIEDVLHRAPAPATPVELEVVEEPADPLAHWRRLLAGSLFGDMTQGELLAVVQRLRLRTFLPGDVVVTEGEPGRSLFILASGRAKVFVRNPAGRNFEVGQLRGGEFFGEISALSGRPRTATVTAADTCEALELGKEALDEFARTHPRVCEVLEAQYIRRASSPEAAAIRAVPVDPGTREKAIEVLEAHFGQSRWEPRMRLHLASALLESGKDQDAVDVLIGLADDLAREGLNEKAVAILKKIERIQHRHVEEVNLAPLKRRAAEVRRAASDAAPLPAAGKAKSRRKTAGPSPPGSKGKPKTEEYFQGWIVDVLRETVRPQTDAEDSHGTDSARATGYARGLAASPLFEGFGEEELVAFIQGLRLLAFDAGDVVITEGEAGESVFLLASGRVRVFVHSAAGHNVPLRDLEEGAFFGEISALSGRPRSATITAVTDCELLELDKTTLGAIVGPHPRVREILEAFYSERIGSRNAALVRGLPSGEAG